MCVRECSPPWAVLCMVLPAPQVRAGKSTAVGSQSVSLAPWRNEPLSPPQLGLALPQEAHPTRFPGADNLVHKTCPLHASPEPQLRTRLTIWSDILACSFRKFCRNLTVTLISSHRPRKIIINAPFPFKKFNKTKPSMGSRLSSSLILDPLRLSASKRSDNPSIARARGLGARG